METLEDAPSPERLELNDLGVVTLRLAEPLAVDAYARQPRDRRVHPHRRGDERHGRRRDGARGVVSARVADPYGDTDVIDSRAPRFNQAVDRRRVGVAVVTGWWWLLALLALQLALGLTLRRRLVPAVRRVLRARAAALRRGEARGLAAAARREHGRARPCSRPRRSRTRPAGPTVGAGARPARRRARAARRRDRLLHGLRGVQARSAGSPAGRSSRARSLRPPAR